VWVAVPAALIVLLALAAGAAAIAGAPLAEFTHPGQAHAPTAISRPAAPTVAPSALPGLLLDPAAINAIMGTTALEVEPVLTTTHLYDDTTDRPECGGVSANANKTVYAGSGWANVQSQHLLELATLDDHNVYQSVVSFTSAKAAADFVAAESDRWKLCKGTSITTTSQDLPPQLWWVDTVTDHGGLLAAISSPENSRGWGCEHALTARNNIVIDVEACDNNVLFQATKIATQIAQRVH
jgi:hypothetical protein